MLVLAAIAGVSAGLFLVMAGMGLLAVIMPVLMVLIVFYKTIRWLGTGKGFDDWGLSAPFAGTIWFDNIQIQ